MKKLNRRAFMAIAAAIGASFSAYASPLFNKKQTSKMLSHHVFFWLKNPESKEDLLKLIEGLRTLKKIETVEEMHIGIPASTEKRPVVDSSYSVSELLFFTDINGQDAYQAHPIHVKFIEGYSHLWEKVIVYDSVDV